MANTKKENKTNTVENKDRCSSVETYDSNTFVGVKEDTSCDTCSIDNVESVIEKTNMLVEYTNLPTGMIAVHASSVGMCSTFIVGLNFVDGNFVRLL